MRRDKNMGRKTPPKTHAEEQCSFSVRCIDRVDMREERDRKKERERDLKNRI